MADVPPFRVNHTPEAALTGRNDHRPSEPRNHRGDSEVPPARPHRAGALVRVNLPPLMGLRDAALTGAEKLLAVCGELPPDTVIHVLGPAVAGMFKDAVDAGERIIGMFNNPDTIARESRLLNNAGILAEISGALADFAALNRRMNAAVEADSTAGDRDGDRDYIAHLNRRMADIGAALAAQLCEAYGRYHERLVRYRDYAVKNLSPENAERYHLAYQTAYAGYRKTIDSILQTISTSKPRSFPE